MKFTFVSPFNVVLTCCSLWLAFTWFACGIFSLDTFLAFCYSFVLQNFLKACFSLLFMPPLLYLSIHALILAPLIEVILSIKMLFTVSSSFQNRIKPYLFLVLPCLGGMYEWLTLLGFWEIPLRPYLSFIFHTFFPLQFLPSCLPKSKYNLKFINSYKNLFITHLLKYHQIH